VNQTSRWRIAAAVAVLAGLVFFLGRFAPIYVHNLKFQSFVSDTAQRVENQAKPDDVLRGWVVDKARQLDLPVQEGDVHIVRLPDGMRIDVRYLVRVDLPGYTVNLHFYPGAGSR
jgi:hypothetical protein